VSRLIQRQRAFSFAPRWQTVLDDYVQALAWSTDGQTLAAASIGGTIAWFSADQGNASPVLGRHAFGASALSWHPDRRRLASSGQDGRVILWDTHTGRILQQWLGGTSWIEHVAWCPDQRHLAWSSGKTIMLARPGETAEATPLGSLPSTIADMCWAPGDATLACAIYGGVWLWSPGQPMPLRTFPWKGSCITVRWSPDRRFLATGDQDATVHFWFTATGIDLRMSGFPGKVKTLSWDFSSRYLATGSGPCLAIWDCEGPSGPEGRSPILLEYQAATIRALAYQPDGPWLAAGYQNGHVVLWEPAFSIDPLFSAGPFDGEITHVAWSPGGRQLAVGTSHGNLAVLDFTPKGNSP